MTAEQRDKLKKLGGAPWVRKRIGEATLPTIEGPGYLRVIGNPLAPEPKPKTRA